MLPVGLTFNSVTAGSAAIAAGKTLTSAPITGGVRIMLFGVNQTLIGSGSLGTIQLGIATTATGTFPLTPTTRIATDPSGNNPTLNGNNGSITVAGGGQNLVPPTLNLPDYLPLNGSVSVDYPANYTNVGFVWDFVPMPSTNGSSASAALSSAARAPFRVSSRVASLAGRGLAPGRYQVTVYAEASGSANSARATDIVTLVSADFSALRVFPQPWRSDRHSGVPLRIDGLPLGSTVKIFTVSGRFVRELLPSTIPTEVAWDLKNDSGDRVASGIYMYLITVNGSSDKATGKLVIIQ